MKKFIKTLIITALVAVSCLSIVGCKGGDNSSSATGVIYKKYNGEDFYTVYDYVDDGATTLNILAEKDGYPVRRIASGAFDGASITDIQVPSSVTEIGKGAFKNMKNLKTITVPFIGKTAESDAFILESSSNNHDKAINAERTISHFFGEESFEQGVKITNNYNSVNTTTCYVPSTFTTVYLTPVKDYAVPMYAFSGMVNLSKVVLNSNVTAIGEGAFMNCVCLKDMAILSNVKTVYARAFKACAMLDTTKLFANATSLEKIGESAFEGTRINSVVLPANVKELGKACFKNSEIKSITLSSQLKEIGVEAFAGCKYLVTVDASSCANTVELNAFTFADCVKLKNQGIDLAKFDYASTTFMDSGVTLG